MQVIKLSTSIIYQDMFRKNYYQNLGNAFHPTVKCLTNIIILTKSPPLIPNIILLKEPIPPKLKEPKYSRYIIPNIISIPIKPKPKYTPCHLRQSDVTSAKVPIVNNPQYNKTKTKVYPRVTSAKVIVHLYKY